MNAAALYALQLVDSELDALAARRERLPERAAVADATRVLDAVRGEQSRQREIIAAAEQEIERLEHESADIDRSLQRLEAQLRGVVVLREAEALTREIDALRAERSTHDDAELEALDRQAAAEAELGVLAGREQDASAEVAAATAVLDGVLAEMQVVDDEIRTRREQAAVVLDAAETQFYEAARARHGGVGFATVEGRRCSGCHVDIAPAELDAIKATPAGELPECPNCARCLVL